MDKHLQSKRLEGIRGNYKIILGLLIIAGVADPSSLKLRTDRWDSHKWVLEPYSLIEKTLP